MAASSGRDRVSRAALLTAAALLLILPRPTPVRGAEAFAGYKPLYTFAIQQERGATDLVFGPDGLLHLTTPNALLRFTTTGRLIGMVPGAAFEEMGLASNFYPVSIVFDRAGVLHVLDSSGIILQLEGEEVVSTIDVLSTSRQEGELFTDMAMDSAGNYYVYAVTGEIRKISPSGALMYSVLLSAGAQPQGSALAMSARDELHVLMHSDGEESIVVFSSAGEYQRQLSLPRSVDTSEVTNIFSDPSGNIVVSARSSFPDSTLSVLVSFSPDGRVISTFFGGAADVKGRHVAHFESLSGIAFDDSGKFYTASQYDGEGIVAYALSHNPNVFFVAVPDDITTERDAEFRFGTGKKKHKFRCSLDGRPFRSCSSPKRYKSLSSGTHVFRVRAKGKSRSLRSISWTIE